LVKAVGGGWQNDKENERVAQVSVKDLNKAGLLANGSVIREAVFRSKARFLFPTVRHWIICAV